MTVFAYYGIQRNDTTNEIIFHTPDGMQGVNFKMLGAVRLLFLISCYSERKKNRVTNNFLLPLSNSDFVTIWLVFDRFDRLIDIASIHSTLTYDFECVMIKCQYKHP